MSEKQVEDVILQKRTLFGQQRIVRFQFNR